MDSHVPHGLRYRFRPRQATGFSRSIIVALVALATVTPLTTETSEGEDEPEGYVGFELRPQSCSADGGATEIPVFTEDACTDVEHTFALTGPNGVTEQLTADKDGPGEDFEVGPYFSSPEGPYGEGEWTITDLDHRSGNWVIPSCWVGGAEKGITSTGLTWIGPATYRVDLVDFTRLTCDWFEVTLDGSSAPGSAPRPLHLKTIPTAEPRLEIGGPGDDLKMKRAVEDRADITVPMRLIDQQNGEESSFEADADGSLLISPGEYELINDLTGETEVFSTAADGATIALVGVPLDAIEEVGAATPPQSGEAAVDPAETSNVNITVSTCEDVVNGTGVDCIGIDHDEPQPVLEVLVDGEPYADGPVLLEDSGVGMRAVIDVPLDATLTVSVVEHIPEGYVAADDADPLVIAATDVPEGDCGGEATCPVLDIVLVPED